MPSGCVAWRSFPATFHHRRRRWQRHRRRRLLPIPRLHLHLHPRPHHPLPLPFLLRCLTAAAPTAGKWIVSETRSPIDYSPVAIATAASSTGPDGVLQLSIQCRGGRSEMVIRSAPLMRRAEDHVVSYAINDAPPMTVTSGLSSSGSGLALKGDVAGFLMSLPAEGAIAFRVADRQGGTLEGRYDLAGIKALVARLAGPCKWPRN